MSRLDTEKYLDVLQLLLDPEVGANNGTLGRVKLMKLLYFIDFNHYEKTGQSITGDVYIKREFGPVPQNAQRMLRLLAQANPPRLKEGWTRYGNYPGVVYETSWEPPFQPENLEWPEQDTVREVIDTWKSHSASSIVLASHGDPPWVMVQFGDVIPYEFVKYRPEFAPSSDADEEIEGLEV